MRPVLADWERILLCNLLPVEVAVVLESKILLLLGMGLAIWMITGKLRATLPNGQHLAHGAYNGRMLGTTFGTGQFSLNQHVTPVRIFC